MQRVAPSSLTGARAPFLVWWHQWAFLVADQACTVTSRATPVADEEDTTYHNCTLPFAFTLAALWSSTLVPAVAVFCWVWLRSTLVRAAAPLATSLAAVVVSGSSFFTSLHGSVQGWVAPPLFAALAAVVYASKAMSGDGVPMKRPLVAPFTLGVCLYARPDAAVTVVSVLLAAAFAHRPHRACAWRTWKALAVGLPCGLLFGALCDAFHFDSWRAMGVSMRRWLWFNVVTSGASLSGVQPWSFYLQRTLHVFPSLLASACVCMAALLLTVMLPLLRRPGCHLSRYIHQRTTTVLGVAAWFHWVLFSSAPHKEHRFVFQVREATVCSRVQQLLVLQAPPVCCACIDTLSVALRPLCVVSFRIALPGRCVACHGCSRPHRVGCDCL